MTENEKLHYVTSRLPEPFYYQDKDSLSFLEQLVAIDSQTQNTDGVNRVQALVADRLSALGFSIEMIANESEKTGDLLIAEKKGKSNETITFIGHADTVFSPSEDLFFEIKHFSRFFFNFE